MVIRAPAQLGCSAWRAIKWVVAVLLLVWCSYYNKQWTEAQRMITDLSQLEVSPEESKPEQVCRRVHC